MTFFSGFGLGTILLPAFSLFLPISIAIAATAVVHLTNNLFKLLITYKDIDYSVFARFGIPAGLASLLGAYSLLSVENINRAITWQIGPFGNQTTFIKLIIGVVIVLFAVFELLTSFKNFSFNTRWIPLGGVLSGFFGGLSGHQGALRSAFLIKLGLSKEVFIATGVAIAVLVDVLRVIVYGYALFSLKTISELGIGGLLLAAIMGAILGAIFGRKLLTNVTLRLVQFIVTGFLLVIGLTLILGLL